MPATNLVLTSNTLLASLSRKEQQSFVNHCKLIRLVSSETLCESGKRIRHVYFPTSGFISLVVTIDNHSNMETGIVGHEGMFGINLILGVNTSHCRALVQGSGTALRMDATRFLKFYKTSVTLQNRLKAYACVQIEQLSQAVCCNRFHLIDSRLARWILMTQDCANSNEFPITQEFLSYMLGVRRVGVTKSAGILQKKKLISYSRGNLKILDRSGLEDAACGCYKKSKEIYKKILG